MGDWPWNEYISLVNDWKDTYNQFISEYNGNRKKSRLQNSDGFGAAQEHPS